MHRLAWLTALILPLFLVALVGNTARVDAGQFATLIELPDGWLPEGVVTGRGPVVYAGSRRHGGIYAADLRTGEGKVVVPPQEGRIAVGLSFDRRTNFIFVAGGPGGAGYVYDAATGESKAAFSFATSETFVNDVVVTRRAAYFTDSMKPVIYRVPLGRGGSLPAPDGFTTIPLGGDYEHGDGFNVNGIDATANGRRLIIVQSNTGRVFRVHPGTGEAREIDLGGYVATAGDGILLRGRTLYVVRNSENLMAKLRLAPGLGSGELVHEITHPAFDIPTTVAGFRNHLYLVNARFTSGDDPSLEYHIVRVGT